jgi:hypothetical protein
MSLRQVAFFSGESYAVDSPQNYLIRQSSQLVQKSLDGSTWVTGLEPSGSYALEAFYGIGYETIAVFADFTNDTFQFLCLDSDGGTSSTGSFDLLEGSGPYDFSVVAIDSFVGYASELTVGIPHLPRATEILEPYYPPFYPPPPPLTPGEIIRQRDKVKDLLQPKNPPPRGGTPRVGTGGGGGDSDNSDTGDFIKLIDGPGNNDVGIII